VVVTHRAPLAVDVHLHTALVRRRPVHQAHACNIHFNSFRTNSKPRSL
jgi:hypothetical protein